MDTERERERERDRCRESGMNSVKERKATESEKKRKERK